MQEIGSEEFSDFNEFIKRINDALKRNKINIFASEKNAILNAVNWYDADSEKVEEGIVQLQGGKLEYLLSHLSCDESQLADYGY